MKDIITKNFSMIDVERNIYEPATLHHQKRKKVKDYINLLQDPTNGVALKIKEDMIIGSKSYEIFQEVPVFVKENSTSSEWKTLNSQFLNYHKSLSVYTLINSAPINNYLSFETGFGFLEDVKVLDVGGGTGHTMATFFRNPEKIDYYLLDPNLRLLHDQFIRLYPKLSYLEMGHIIGNAETLPIKNNSFDIVLSISAIDHLDDYLKFINEAFRVLKKGGKFLVSSHLDIIEAEEDQTKVKDKIFSSSFFERLSRYLYYKKQKVGGDDHTLHLENEIPIELALQEVGFKIIKKECFKRHFYFVAEK